MILQQSESFSIGITLNSITHTMLKAHLELLLVESDLPKDVRGDNLVDLFLCHHGLPYQLLVLLCVVQFKVSTPHVD